MSELSGIAATGLRQSALHVFLPGDPASLEEPYLGRRRANVRIDCAQGRAVRKDFITWRWGDYVQAVAIGLKKWLKRELILNHSPVAEVVAQGKTSAVIGEQNRAWRNLLAHKFDGFFHELPTLVPGLDIGAGRVRKHIANYEDQRESHNQRFSPPLAV